MREELGEDGKWGVVGGERAWERGGHFLFANNGAFWRGELYYDSGILSDF